VRKSKIRPAKLVQLDSPWFFDPGVVRVFPPDDGSSDEELLQRLSRHEATRPYIVEDGHHRRLHFSHDATQSVMSLEDPQALVNAYTRKMMSFLLLNPRPRHILMIGLGGGSLAKFCYRHCPQAQITVVEIDQDVIALRDEFHVPADDGRFRVVHDDGARYVQHLEDRVDVVLVDAFDADGISLSLPQSDFYDRVAAQLTDNGILVMNLSGQGERYVDNLRAIGASFGEHVVLVPVAGDENVLVFALKQPPPRSITDELEVLAERLQTRLQLNFPRYLRRICQGLELTGLASG
jgi:spermidine synthase